LLRFANVRANAGALGVTNDHNITALVIIESIAIIEPVQVVASVQRGLLFQRRTASGTAFADSQPVRLSQSVACSGQCISTLRFAEGFAGAFKTRATPLRANRLHPLITTSSGKAVSSETGHDSWVVNDGVGRTVVLGLVDVGTRLIAVFNNVPLGVRLFVSSRETASSPPSAIHAELTTSEVAPFTPVGASDLVAGTAATALTITNGTAVAVWEIIARDPHVQSWLEFGVFVQYEAEPSCNSPALGTVTVTGDLAPTTTVITASPNHSIPRFQRLSRVVSLFTIEP
jgi:hypothetical protein